MRISRINGRHYDLWTYSVTDEELSYILDYFESRKFKNPGFVKKHGAIGHTEAFESYREALIAYVNVRKLVAAK